MKNTLLLLLFASLFILVSCGGDKPKENKPTPPKVEKKTEPTAEKAVEKTTDTEPAKTKEEPKQDPGATPEQLAKAKEIIASVSDEDIAAVEAKKKFKMLCANCHGFKGDLMSTGAKDLTVSKASLTDAVAQVYFGKGLMTPFKGVLTDAEIVAVSKYVETLRK